MTTLEIPLGSKETQSLEFKGRDSLNDRYAIGREVVGMLNTEHGGEIWVGLGEAEHRAVQVEGIHDPEVEVRTLRDFLMDSVEPLPLAGEIEVEAQESEEGGAVLRIAVQGTPERQPYALLRKGAWVFVVRVGDRLRPMTREEILGQERRAGDSTQCTVQQIIDEQERKRQSGQRLLWLRLQPGLEGQLDLQQQDLGVLLTDPTQTGNRRAGANFSAAYVYGEHQPRLVPGSGHLEIGAEGYYFLRIRRDGGVEFEAPLHYLFGPPTIPGYEKELVLSAVRVAEFLASVLRLLRGLIVSAELWQKPPGDQVLGQLALFGLRDAYLMPEAARAFALLPGPPLGRVSLEAYPEEDFTLDRILTVSRSEVVENPDRMVFRMLRELFEAFGYPESEMPKEFDRKTGRLVLPE